MQHQADGSADPSSSFAGRQQEVLQQIKAQQHALALLSRNLPVPSQLLTAVGSPPYGLDTQVQTQAADSGPAAGQSHVAAADASANAAASAGPGTNDPLQDVKPLRPPGWPPDADAVAEARAAAQEVVKAKLQHRIQELENLPDHLPQELQLKALIELKALRLAGLQHRVRAGVHASGTALHAAQQPGTLLEWRAWRRPPPDPLGLGAAVAAAAAAPPPAPVPDPAEVARLKRAAARAQQEQQAAGLAAQLAVRQEQHAALRQRIAAMRAAAAAADAERLRLKRIRDAEVAQRRAFLSAVLSQQRAMYRPAAAVAQRKRAQRVAAVRAWHAREARKLNKVADMRLAALRDDNYEEYVRLAQQAKDGRLNELMEKTDAIMTELGTKVQEQRAEAEAAAGVNGILAPVAAAASAVPQGEAERLLEGQRQYYSMVHAVKEKVEVPSTLQGGTLRPYQLDGLRFLLSLYNNRLNGVLADEMGLGKTVQTVALVAALAEVKHCSGPHLVLAPKAVLPNWGAEFARWLPSVRAVIYDGTPDDRRALQREVLEPRELEVLLTHYDLAIRDKSALRKIDWEVLVVDEGHRLKNAESRLVSVLRGFTFRHRVLLTGTPLQNNLGELWSLLNFLLPKVFDSADTFDEWFAAPFQGSGEDMREALKEEEQMLIITRLHQVIRPFMLRRTKAEVEKELPAKTAAVIKCGMSAWQRALYRQISEQGRVMLEPKASRSLQNIAMQLRKACNHPYLFMDGAMPLEDGGASAAQQQLVRASGKLAFLSHALPKLQATGHRVLLFSQMTRALDLIEDALTALQLPYLRLDGSTKTDDRAAMLHDFNSVDSKAFCFLLSTRAGGLGLNLQTADTVIMFDSDWNPAMDAQAEDRAHRIGQKKAVLVLVLVTAGTIEEAILARASEKRSLDAKVIQAGMFNDKSTAAERQEVLQALLRRGDADASGHPHSLPEINSLLARSPEEAAVFEEMDAAEPPPELLHQDEVPAWVTSQPSPPLSPSATQDGGGDGKGSRKRRRGTASGVTYDDALSDSAFAELLDGGADVEEYVANHARKRRRQDDDGEASARSEASSKTARGAPSRKRSRGASAEAAASKLRPKQNGSAASTQQQRRGGRAKPGRRQAATVLASAAHASSGGKATGRELARGFRPSRGQACAKTAAGSAEVSGSSSSSADGNSGEGMSESSDGEASSQQSPTEGRQRRKQDAERRKLEAVAAAQQPGRRTTRSAAAAAHHASITPLQPTARRKGSKMAGGKPVASAGQRGGLKGDGHSEPRRRQQQQRRAQQQEAGDGRQLARSVSQRSGAFIDDGGADALAARDASGPVAAASGAEAQSHAAEQQDAATSCEADLAAAAADHERAVDVYMAATVGTAAGAAAGAASGQGQPVKLEDQTADVSGQAGLAAPADICSSSQSQQPTAAVAAPAPAASRRSSSSTEVAVAAAAHNSARQTAAATTSRAGHSGLEAAAGTVRDGSPDLAPAKCIVDGQLIDSHVEAPQEARLPCDDAADQPPYKASHPPSKALSDHQQGEIGERTMSPASGKPSMASQGVPIVEGHNGISCCTSPEPEASVLLADMSMPPPSPPPPSPTFSAAANAAADAPHDGTVVACNGTADINDGAQSFKSIRRPSKVRVSCDNPDEEFAMAATAAANGATVPPPTPACSPVGELDAATGSP